MTGEAETEQIPDLALIPVRVGPDIGNRRHFERAFPERDFDADVVVPFEGDEVIDHREIGRRQALAMNACPLIDRRQVVEATERPLGAASQIAEHIMRVFPGDPKGRYVVDRCLRGDCERPEPPAQVVEDPLPWVRHRDAAGLCQHPTSPTRDPACEDRSRPDVPRASGRESWAVRLSLCPAARPSS